jgi:hypothetical protein
MSLYYFHLHDRQRIDDPDGTELVNLDAAREHAAAVAQELTRNSFELLGRAWSEWTMSIHDHQGEHLFSFRLPGDQV